MGARLFGERYEFPPAWGVTRRCLPGGMSLRGDRSPEGVTGQAAVSARGSDPPEPPDGQKAPVTSSLGLGRQGIKPSSRARATASVRLAAPSLPRTWVTCFLTVS